MTRGEGGDQRCLWWNSDINKSTDRQGGGHYFLDLEVSTFPATKN